MLAPSRSSARATAGKRATTAKASDKPSGRAGKRAGKATGRAAKMTGKATGRAAKMTGKSLVAGKVAQRTARGTGKVAKGPARGTGKVAKGPARGAGKVAQGTARGAGKVAQGTARGAGKLARTGAWMAARAATREVRLQVRTRVLTSQAWWRGVRRGLRARPRRPMVVNASAPQLTAAAVGGAGLAFLLDPANGKRRRKVALDRTMAIARRTARRGAQKAQYTAGQAQGAVHEATSAPSVPDNDRTLADKVRSEIFRPADAPSGAVNVSAVDGIVYLRGEVADGAQIERLVSATMTVPGVLRVENLLHTPGTPAPTGGAG